MGKHKKKSKKPKRHHSSSSSDEWVEADQIKEKSTGRSPSSDSEQKKKTTRRSPSPREDSPKKSKIQDDHQDESWLNFATYSNEDRKKQREEAKKQEKEKQQYDPTKCPRELNPYWKDGGDGLPKFQKPRDDDSDDGAYRFLDVESVTIKEEELDISDVDESELFPDTPSLKQKTIKETETKKYKCDECLATFVRKWSLYSHMNTHTKQKKYECDKCSAVFYKRTTAHKHRKAHDEYEMTGVTCTVCNVWFKTLKSLEIHERTHKATNKCDMCPRTFQFVNNLLVHKAAIHNKDAGLLKCPFCEDRYKYKDVLLRHINTHTREQQKQNKRCLTCGEAFSGSNALKKHNERVHQPEREFSCDLCNSVFDTSVGLKLHKERHSLERRYFCQLCDRGFIFNHQLTRHMISHSEDGKFQCTICGIKFKMNRFLKSHMEISHSKGSRKGIFTSSDNNSCASAEIKEENSPSNLLPISKCRHDLIE